MWRRRRCCGFGAMRPALLIFLVIPFGEGWVVRDLDIGVLYLFALSALSVIAIFMGGYASNNKYSLLGAIRSVAQNLAYEIPLLLGRQSPQMFSVLTQRHFGQFDLGQRPEAFTLAVTYLLLSGASVPTQRAFVMIVVALVAILFDRSALTMRTVAIAAIVILVLNPESWIDPSFQMSFAAVVALIAAYEWWNARRIPDAEPPGPLRRLWLMLMAAAATSLIAGLATAPFAAYHFNRFADYGVAANVMAMPVVSFVTMPAGVLALILMPFGLEDAPLAVMEAGLEVMLSIAHWVASWPGATQAVAAWPLTGLVLIVAGGLWLAIWLSSWRWLGCVPVVAGLALLPFAASPDILIASDGDNIAVRDADGTLHLLSSRRGRFDAEIWLRRDGDQRAVKEAAGGTFTCDAAGCLAPIRGSAQQLLVAFTGETIAEDCARAAVVVAAFLDTLVGDGYLPREG